MTANFHSETELRRLIGFEIRLEGQACQIVEVLIDGPALVVECVAGNGRIQANQFGDGNRRVHRHHTVPVYSAIGENQLHPLFEQIWQAFNAAQ